ncbi:hypothetical protein SAMN05216436_11443 [bacterium A37T11]|nr:hypothetical protein SAMN05216436_11443 [bacterium A37T11]
MTYRIKFLYRLTVVLGIFLSPNAMGQTTDTLIWSPTVGKDLEKAE